MSFVTGAVARAAIVLVLFNVASKLTALVREMVIARQFGATSAMDAYLVAFSLPSVLFYLFTGALSTVVVPIYSEYAAAGREREAWGLFGTFFNVLLLLLVVVTALGLLLAPWLVKLLAPGFPGDTLSLAISLTRWMFPLLIFSGLTALFSGLLNARNVFAITALNGPLSNIAVIIAVLALGSLWGVYGMTLGVLVGGVAGAVVQLPALRRVGFSFRPGVALNHPDLKKIFKLILPITIGFSISETYILIDRYLASGLAEGSIAALNYANRLIQMPLGLFVTAVGTAVFPSLTRKAAEKDLRGLGEGVLRSLRLVVLACVPSAIVLLVLREPLVTLFFKRGVFDDRAAGMTAIALFFYAFGLVGQAGEFILTRGFFSLQDTRTPMVLSAIAVLVNLGFSLALIGSLRHGGLALANSIAALVDMILLTFFLNRRLGGMWAPGMWRFILFVMLASLAMGGAIEAMSSWLNLPAASGTITLAGQVGLVATAGLVVYLAALTVLRIEEARRLWDFVKQKFTKSSREA
ncbi:MAG: putative peptidoglycan biosynthesis protein MurJ [Pelotomaculum sp. PtaB.Bin013]|uniref:Probable lipid II flippase MurJ n=1 Tax=Pelotomaculum isophthalicicum JI TaxID=947010 RepID=A0A9X4JV64_9FIRM|nr:murein biosynthesis integral membrane protein MurJ [Pelotomaculum isophthalicicum]MDF9406958.1 murein biosynthesis integral membrane protein MurJ [Pelotomaculum isophthalicicum JI]OPX86975.1 MAG: putative peptidoglycan biosynthesis protein MurJ [Pelotomaculum sp. PtaB.Bin013]